MSHDIAYTLQHPRLFLLLHCHHYPPSPLSSITTILLSAQQGTPQTDQRHFVLNACAVATNVARRRVYLTRPNGSSSHYAITTILLGAQQGTPHPDQRHFDLNCCDRCRPMLHIGWFFILLHHHHHLPRCPARHPRTTSNLMCRPSF